MSAIRDWIVALVPDKSETEPAAPKLDPMVMLPGLPALHACAILDTLSCTVTAYLDSQQRWHQFVQNGLQSFLLHLCASMHLAAKVCMEQEDVLYTPVHHGFEVMSTASGSRSLAYHL